MAKAQKYDTIEEVIAATGVELTDKTRVFLESFVKKATGESSGAKKKELLASAELFGVTGLDTENENLLTLQIKIITFLFEAGRKEEMDEFAAKQHLFVTENGEIHRIKQAVKKIEDRNAGVKEGSVGYNTILLLKNPEYAGLTSAELATKLQEDYGQPTTPACIQWYLNFCHKKVKAITETMEAARAAGTLTEAQELTYMAQIEHNTVCARSKTAKAATGAGTNVTLGAQLTMEKALAPRGFQKKAKPENTALGDDLATTTTTTEPGAELDPGQAVA